MSGPVDDRPGSRCGRSETDLSAYLDGDLSPERTDALERHVEGCPACRAVLAGLRAAIDLCRRSAHQCGRSGEAGCVQRAVASAREELRRRGVIGP